MELPNFVSRLVQQRDLQMRSIWVRMHLDAPLLVGILLLTLYGLFVLFSASDQSWGVISKQLSRFLLGFILMFIAAQIPPEKYRVWIPAIYILGMFLLVLVLIFGHTGKGAQRWLNLGFIRFQPSEIMKLAVPVMVAWYLGTKNLPPRFMPLLISAILIIVPAALIAKQPDLGTALMVAAGGGSVLLLTGIRWRWLIALGIAIAASAPIAWLFMHDYQRSRVLTFLSPDRDPLGTGYHIIQSKIAIGSGGFIGKGWFNGTQSHLDFLPEHSTDFIFSVIGEEFGFIGALILLVLYTFIMGRCLYIASNAYDSFTRLLAGSLALTFFFALFVNIGMVSGILPVVGMPLPLVSYGGTAVVTVMTAFGILMSIQTHRHIIKTY
jgi:rod shape determining protein RodA